jgi:hypothetical protein
MEQPTCSQALDAEGAWTADDELSFMRRLYEKCRALHDSWGEANVWQRFNNYVYMLPIRHWDEGISIATLIAAGQMYQQKRVLEGRV